MFHQAGEEAEKSKRCDKNQPQDDGTAEVEQAKNYDEISFVWTVRAMVVRGDSSA